VPAYYAQIAAHMIAADQRLFGGAYQPALRSAFLRHGILSPAGATTIAVAAGQAPAAAAPRHAGPPNLLLIPGQAYGISEDFSVRTPAEPLRFRAAGASPAVGSLDLGDAERVAAAFVEDLFRLGRVAVPGQFRAGATPADAPGRTPTHHLVRVDGRLVLARLLFD
jgi:hypothetical protein